jgi:hypothetical protein
MHSHLLPWLSLYMLTFHRTLSLTQYQPTILLVLLWAYEKRLCPYDLVLSSSIAVIVSRTRLHLM